MGKVLFLIDACNVLLSEGKKCSLKVGLRKIKSVLMRKKWLLENGNSVQIVIDNNHRKGFAVIKELCFDSVELVWTYKNKKTGIIYKADDYIIDNVFSERYEKESQFSLICIVSNDLALRKNIAIPR